jgi:transposase
LGESRCAAVTHVSADAAQWIADEVALNCPNAVRCADPFYADVLVMPICGLIRLWVWRCKDRGRDNQRPWRNVSSLSEVGL